MITPHKTQKTYFNQNVYKNNIWYAIFEGEKHKVIKIWCFKLYLIRARLRIDPRIDETKTVSIQKDLSE